MKIMESGTKLNAATSAGVTYRDFTSAKNEVNGAIELAEAMWPEHFAPQAKKELVDASGCWTFCAKLWGQKIQYSDDSGSYSLPKEMDQYPQALSDTIAITETKYGKIIYWNQLGIALSVSSKKFEKAREQILAELKN
jgi:hypothetical protein